MRAIVGSTNPVKIQAVRAVFEEVFGECEVMGKEVESGVAEQPRGEEKTRKGAKNRAQEAVKEGEYGVGIEGGVCEIEGKLFECAWCVVAGKDGQLGYGGGLYFELPEKIARKIRAGGELGPVMNELLKREDVKKQEGAVGVLTKKRVTRTGAYKQLVHLALMRFVSPEWWE